MEQEQRPNHYTFVFPRKLTSGERDFWRDSFLEEQLRLHPSLSTLDYWDDLADRLEGSPDLVDRLSDGALADYVRTVFAQAAGTGVNPLASAPDLVGDATQMAARAVAIGASDPDFVYGSVGREAGVADENLPEGALLFQLQHDRRTALPKYTLSMRAGSSITELTADPRAESIVQPEPWFADTPEGATARELARGSLAKGRPISLRGPHVGVDPRSVPDRFRSLLDDAGLMRDGELQLGVSEPLDLTMVLQTHTGSGFDLARQLRMFRVPS